MKPWVIITLIALLLITITAVIYFKQQEKMKELEKEIAQATQPQVTDVRSNIWDVIGGLLNV